MYQNNTKSNKKMHKKALHISLKIYIITKISPHKRTNNEVYNENIQSFNFITSNGPKSFDL